MGDKEINEERVAREAKRHQGSVEDPEKKEADDRHSAARDRVLPRDTEGRQVKDPKELERGMEKEEEEHAEKREQARKGNPPKTAA